MKKCNTAFKSQANPAVQFREAQNTLSWKGVTDTIKSNSWPAQGSPKSHTLCLRLLCIHFLSSGCLVQLCKKPTDLTKLCPEVVLELAAAIHSFSNSTLERLERKIVYQAVRKLFVIFIINTNGILVFLLPLGLWDPGEAQASWTALI